MRSDAAGAPAVSVVIPALNERENLELLLPALREVLADLGVPHEIVVVDGGSRDGTAQAAATRGARVVAQAEPGYGGALLAGFAATRAPYVVTMDADLSHRPVFVHELWKHRHDAEVLIASRYVDGGRADMDRLRRLLSHLLNRSYARVLSLPVADLSSGFRMYRRDALAGLRPQARDFDFLEELLIRAHAQGWRVAEVPFHYMARGSGRSHARLVKFGWALLRTLVRMWQLRNSVESADYDYRAFDSPIWLQRYWQRARHRIVTGWVGAEPIVDVGCGSSRIILDLPNALGVDVLQNKLRWLRPRHARLTRASGDALPLRDGSVGTLITSEVIEHVTNAEQHLAEAARVLRPGGTLVAGTPDYGRWLWWALEWVYGKVLPGAYAHEHVTHYTRATLAASLARHGFDVADVRYVGACEMIFRARRR
ncbi:MAG TPA: glycosyltransferase [Methylomirabilota bacterium]|nr:glycosyltransferase [Methylomirabilota bacterium]